jgi:hypothetical protein
MTRIFRRQRGADDGVALVTVMVTMLVLTVFVAAALTFSVNSRVVSRNSQDTGAAISVAQAGVDDFVKQLNLDLERLGDLGLNTWSDWRSVGRDATQQYRYRVVSSSNGVVNVEVQGRGGVGNNQAVQAVYASLQSRSFLSYVYMSDVEVTDPQLVGQNAACGAYYYAGRSSRTDCSEIQWATGDVVNGPLHSNDALQINGTVKFRSQLTTTSWPSAKNKNGLNTANRTWWGGQGAPLPNSYPPVYDEPLTLPDTNSSLLDYVQPAVNGTTSANRVGCYYQGNTRITFAGTKMKVLSPLTTRSDTPSRCYNPANANTEQTVDIPPVIYVDSAASSTSCSVGNVGYPISGEDYTAGSATATSWGRAPNYSCRRGTAYIQGSVKARSTLSTVDDTVITGNLTLDSQAVSSSDVLGIIAGNYAWVYHPLDGGNNMLTTTAQTNPPRQRVNTIQAGILALGHSFVVQNYNSGGLLGTLNVTGAIAQRFRGPVGTGSSSGASTGYVKNYVYDDRLAYLRPPYFLEPTDTWSVVKTVQK